MTTMSNRMITAAPAAAEMSTQGATATVLLAGVGLAADDLPLPPAAAVADAPVTPLAFFTAGMAPDVLGRALTAGTAPEDVGLPAVTAGMAPEELGLFVL